MCVCVCVCVSPLFLTFLVAVIFKPSEPMKENDKSCVHVYVCIIQVSVCCLPSNPTLLTTVTDVLSPAGIFDTCNQYCTVHSVLYDGVCAVGTIQTSDRREESCWECVVRAEPEVESRQRGDTWCSCHVFPTVAAHTHTQAHTRAIECVM